MLGNMFSADVGSTPATKYYVPYMCFLRFHFFPFCKAFTPFIKFPVSLQI